VVFLWKTKLNLVEILLINNILCVSVFLNLFLSGEEKERKNSSSEKIYLSTDIVDNPITYS